MLLLEIVLDYSVESHMGVFGSHANVLGIDIRITTNCFLNTDGDGIVAGTCFRPLDLEIVLDLADPDRVPCNPLGG